MFLLRFAPRVVSILLGVLALGFLPHAGVAAIDPVLLQRAEKIVQPIVSGDAARAARVRDLIARQYADLRLVHADRDAALATAKQQADRAVAEAAATVARDKALSRQAVLRTEFLRALSRDLTPAQVDAVKDGMTYGVLPLTFRVYQDMVPHLTAEQKKQIYEWLVEARENAMDAGSSEEKHAWFGKYKGRINNYLAAAGVDLKRAEHEMIARQKAARQSGANKP